MVTLKEVLATLEIVKNEYSKGLFICITVIEREEELRTKLAKALARDNPPLNPNSNEDLVKGVIELPSSTILSSFADAIFKKYCLYVFRAMRINPGSHITFKDIRSIFQDIRSKKVNLGMERSWRPKELRAFNLLCIRISNDNHISVSEVMQEFEEKNANNLIINEASIDLAINLFKELEA
ncbi:MAG: hypothetical protein P1P90_03670 [Patescibacteria group bacterium]|nr:hypothetical protein [Patescibacteria group bacterium]